MDSLEDKIKRFLGTGSGSGSGDGDGYGSGSGSGSGDGDGYGSGSGSGSGYGDGDGYGYGSGSGYGDGDGYGYGDGSGYGSGYGDGIKSYAGKPVYRIDGVNTIIDEVRGNFAKGYIVCFDMTLQPCWIAKIGGYYAHGENIHKAHLDAIAKHQRNMPVEERIDRFIDEHPDMTAKYEGKDLFRWHNILTGSCEMGRKSFCRDHDIDPDRDSFTVEEFIWLTCKSYGSEVIMQLADRLSVKL